MLNHWFNQIRLINVGWARLLPGTSSLPSVWEESRTPGRRRSVWMASRRWRSESGPPGAGLSRYRTWSRQAGSASGWAVCGLLHQEGAKTPGAHVLAHRGTVGCHCSHYICWCLRCCCCCTLCTPHAGSDHPAHPGHRCPLPGLCCPQAHPTCHQTLRGGWAEAEQASLVLGGRDGVREASRLDEAAGKAEMQQHFSANRRRQLSSNATSWQSVSQCNITNTPGILNGISGGIQNKNRYYCFRSYTPIRCIVYLQASALQRQNIWLSWAD